MHKPTPANAAWPGRSRQRGSTGAQRPALPPATRAAEAPCRRSLSRAQRRGVTAAARRTHPTGYRPQRPPHPATSRYGADGPPDATPGTGPPAGVFLKKMRHAWGTEIERTTPRYPATVQKAAGSVKLFYAFRPKTDGLGATTCHACPLPRSRLRCAATKRGAPTVLLKNGSGQMMLPMTPADGKTERNGRKRQALLRRQHGPDRRQHGLLSEIQGHDWPKHAADDPNTPRAHIDHTAGRKIAQTQQGTAPGRSKALHDVKKTNDAPPCHAATHREVCGKKNVILP